MTENILDNPTSTYRNESKTNNHKQNQNRSVLANIELLSNSNNNNNNNTVLSTETTSNDTATFLENMSSPETLKLISGLLQNKKHLLKRILDKEDNDFTTKRSRNNENEEITLPFFDMHLSGSLSSTPARTESNTIIVIDELLIKDNWFATKTGNCNMNLLPGFLKAFPKNNPQDQLDFARLLAKYKIHYNDYEESFKKNKIDTFPRTLTAADVKHKTWLFSYVLADYVEKNNFLHERIVLDPSAIIQENNTSPMNMKRNRKSKQRYSP
ncbi:unnamed protein product [Rotaria sp. Silwood2]|nr:unnamed protein product [Rotaria sp. Silwood2]CAF4283426.1 unnamed protein product [Rotaria sp. Silwood2]